jgi:hypothetical protein
MYAEEPRIVITPPRTCHRGTLSHFVATRNRLTSSPACCVRGSAATDTLPCDVHKPPLSEPARRQQNAGAPTHAHTPSHKLNHTMLWRGCTLGKHPRGVAKAVSASVIARADTAYASAVKSVETAQTGVI